MSSVKIESGKRNIAEWEKQDAPIELCSYIVGNPVHSSHLLSVFNPYNNELVGTVTLAGIADVESAVQAALKGGGTLSRYQRYSILEKARRLLEERREAFAALITAESGLCIREARHETGRSLDVLQFAAIEALEDDGQVFSCDVSPHGKNRKIFTVREPLSLAVAITPFNHPLNQVVHKLAPAIAVGTPVILKPSEKTPLSAIRFVELLYEAGLPAYMLSVLLGETAELAETLVQDERVDVVSFTGSVSIGKRIAKTAGYKKRVLELGGNDPLIILEDADMELALHLAAEGSFRNSGQRCTAVKRILVQENIHDEFVKKFIEKAKEYTLGDPSDPETRVGTVINEKAAINLERVMKDAVTKGAEIVSGGGRKGALFEPTIIVNVPRHVEMVTCESFGPLAPVIKVKDLDDALEVANSTVYGLSSGIVTNSMDKAIKAIKTLKAGTVNINEVPGYRIEKSPFGGIKDSGFGVKEGVVETMKALSFVKTFSLPW